MNQNRTIVVDLSKYKDESAAAGLLIGLARTANVPFVWGHKSLRLTTNEALAAHREVREAIVEATGARAY